MDLKTHSENVASRTDVLKESNALPRFTNTENFTKNGFKTLMESIRHANTLPTQQDYSFYNAQESFKKIMSSEGNRILTSINSILNYYGLKNNIKTSILDHKTELLIEANDTILERVANNIDEMNGIKKSTIDPIELQSVSAPLPINGSWNKLNKTKFSVTSLEGSKSQCENSNSPVRLLTAKNIIRPQKFFKDKIDNSNLYPWEPRIKEKPNSLKPLAIFLEETERGEEFSHPYEFELENFLPPEEQLLEDKVKPTYPRTLAETNFMEVNTIEQLNEMVEDLRNYKIISVDVEHHSYRTFMGITCLMQISTGDTDYVIDTLVLRDKLFLLNEIFTKQSILKVFHGADSDILWLQRDLSIYVVNMFDTHQASKILEYSSLSLASLLERFCNFKPNKHFQLADWRIRPLPDVLKEYAREDTHYLIYIYQILKNELLKKAGGSDRLLITAYQRSTDICKQRYFKPRLSEESHLDFYRMCKRLFDNRQMYALEELYKWRDQKAREEDESTGYVLPNHMLLQIAETLPREMQGILACCNPIPPLVRSYLLELHHIVLKARDKPLEKQILQEDTRARGSIIQIQKLNVDSPLHCPHDLSKNGDFRDDLPTVLGVNKHDYMKSIVQKCKLDKNCSSYSIFTDQEKEITPRNAKNRRFLAPFERYQFVKPFIQDEEKKLALQKEKEAEKKTIDSEKNTFDIKPNIEDIKPKISAVTATIEIEDDIDKINRNLENLVEENKTDEERLALIRNHFDMLSKKTQEDEELAKRREEKLYEKATKMVSNQSLSEMGGTKKRKRDDSYESHLPFDNKNIEHRFLNPAPYETSDKYVPLGQKRRKTSNDDIAEAGTSLNQIWKKKKKRNKTKAQQIRPDLKKRKTANVVMGEGTNETKTTDEISRQGKKRKRNNDDGDFEAFDYSSVDFRQFQGGAGSVNEGKNIKSNFKNKAKRKIVNKAFNKSGVFDSRKKK
ncbi:hypothetical protein HHI36_008581 [Cryptolaemus montrouzieri]|uniref:Exosome complex component 10 homolog n=1 Tax=Cryptolaemus montrouzieri TaxID=559131 RepID=A0ABD2MSY0_9CUCU